MALGKSHYMDTMRAQTVPNGNDYPAAGAAVSLSPDYNSFAVCFDLSLLPGESSDGEVPLSPPTQLLQQPSVPQQDFYDGLIAPEFQMTAMKMENDGYGSGYDCSFDTPPRSEYGDHEFGPASTPRYAPTYATELSSGIGTPLLPPSPPSSCSSGPGSPASVTSPDLTRVKLEAGANAYDTRDHETLRGALEDTSFQRRLNIRPLSLEALWPAPTKQDFEDNVQDLDTDMDLLQMDLDLDGLDRLDVEEDLRPVLSLALQQVKKDVMATCALLDISPDPCCWTVEQARSWLTWTAAQFSLPPPSENSFTEDGAALAQLPEQTFIAREPQSGSILHAQLEIWKAARLEQCPQLTSDVEDDEPTALPADTSEDQNPTTAASPVPANAGRQGGAHIHLWQFLKELLAGPQTHGAAIRWLDRSRGVFKIEDSVRVARLWGKRKNRPAMNYDKLSRSIRQYYKKGIMKKTERSQRLVYQFCHPYCL